MRPGLERGMKSVPKVRRLLQVLAVAVLLGGITAVVVGGFVEGRQEAEQEAEREEPIKPPLRVTMPERGEPIITLDAEAQHAIGLQVATLPPGQVPGSGARLWRRPRPHDADDAQHQLRRRRIAAQHRAGAACRLAAGLHAGAGALRQEHRQSRAGADDRGGGDRRQGGGRGGAIAGAHLARHRDAGMGSGHRQLHGRRWRPHHASDRTQRVPPADHAAARRAHRQRSQRRLRRGRGTAPGAPRSATSRRQRAPTRASRASATSTRPAPTAACCRE